LVRAVGLEPTRRETHAPQTCLSAYSSMLAYSSRFFKRQEYYIKVNVVCQGLFLNFRQFFYFVAFYKSIYS